LIDIKNTKSLALSATPSKKADFVLNKANLIKLHQFKPPSIMWHRPTSWLTDQTHDWTMTKSLVSFYNAKSEATKIQTTQNNNNGSHGISLLRISQTSHFSN
jgi:hypothetical protein